MYDNSHVTSEKGLAPICSLSQTRQVDCLQTKRKGGISEDKKSFFIKRLSTSPLGKTSPNQKAEKEKPITLVVAEERKEAGERKKKLGTQMAIWFRAIIDRATNNGTFETINQQLHTEASWFYSSHFEQNSYQNAE